MKTLLKILGTIGAIAIVGALLVAFEPSISLGAKSSVSPSGGLSEQAEYTFFTATTTSATSTNITAGYGSSGYDAGYFVVAGAKNVNLFFSRGDTTGQGNSGSSAFSIEVSQSTTTVANGVWVDYNELKAVGASATADTYFTRTGTDTISAATSTDIYSMDTKGFYAIRCIVVETTDGEHSCSALAEF